MSFYQHCEGLDVEEDFLFSFKFQVAYLAIVSLGEINENNLAALCLTLLLLQGHTRSRTGFCSYNLNWFGCHTSSKPSWK